MMQLGYASAILPDLSLEEVVQFTADNGFSTVELMCWPAGKAERRYAGVTHIDVVGFTAADAARVNELAASAGITISGLGYYPNPLTPDGDEAQVAIDHIKRVIEASALLGIGIMNSFVGRDWTKSVDDNWPRFLEVWTPLKTTTSRSASKTAPWPLPTTNGPAAKTWPTRPPSGAACSPTSPATTSASTTTPPT